MVCFPQGGWEGAAEVCIKSNTSQGRERGPRLRTAHLFAATKAGFCHNQVLWGVTSHFSPRFRSFFAAAEIPRVMRAQISPPSPFCSLCSPRPASLIYPFYPGCTEKLHQFYVIWSCSQDRHLHKPSSWHPLCKLSVPKAPPPAPQ